jgi:hypothetical protein
VNDFLVSYLDAIDERLLEYLDDDDELKLDTVQRLRFYTSAVLDGSLSPDHVVEDWADWFQLVPAFVAAYGTDELKEAEAASVFLEAVEEHENVSLDDAVRAYLKALEAWLDVYPEMRATEE